MDVRQVKVVDLFCSQQQVVLVDLQRRDRGNEQQWRQLWKDIEPLGKTNSDIDRLFLGNVILATASRGRSDLGELYVVDGQHRVIALAALLAAVRDRQAELGNHKAAQEIQQAYLSRVHRSDIGAHKIVRAGKPPLHLPVLSPGERSGTPDWMLRAYDFFRGKISREPVDPGLVSWGALRKIDMVTITGEYHSAISMFLSIATKGRPTPRSRIARLTQLGTGRKLS